MFDIGDTIKNEYRGIEKTEFWVRYMSEIVARRHAALSRLIVSRIENVPALQGEIRAYETILALPTKLVDGTTADEAAPEA